MPAALSCWTRPRSRSKYAGLNFVRSNFDLPSDASPGPVRCQGCGATVKSGGELAVVGNPWNVGSSVAHNKVKLWLCATSILTYAVKSKGWIAPFVPQSWKLFQV